ncbi:MAG: transcriptional repressor [Anaerolineae bacterium]|nr:transcriptional repressor [Anaerolineae bacterium]
MQPSQLSETWLNTLQNQGYRLTAPLKAIVEILAGSTRALSPVDLYDLGRKSTPGMGLVTVYRALEKLEESGLIQRVHQSEGCHMFIRSANGHEHLLLCQSCGKTVFFEGDDLGDLFKRVSEKYEFNIQEHWLQLYGLCAECYLNKDGQKKNI